MYAYAYVYSISINLHELTKTKKFLIKYLCMYIQLPK